MAKATEKPDNKPAKTTIATNDDGSAKMDETIPGGAYIVDGRWVNAEGEPIDDPTK